MKGAGMFGTGFRGALIALALMLSLPAGAFAQGPGQGPGGPILVVTGDSFGSYYAEILEAEGLNEFAVAGRSALNAQTLAGYHVVVLGAGAVSAPQASALSAWVQGGGNLIAMRPAASLAPLLGLGADTGDLANGYIDVANGAGPGAGITGDTMQFHGTADRRPLNGATAVATLYSDATTATTSAAVTLRSVGSAGGQAAAFAYDLASSVVWTRQGNPIWDRDERDGFSPVRSNDLFLFDSDLSSDPSLDWVNLDKVHIPQADEQQRLLANLITQMSIDRLPLPRFWYFPRGEKAVVVMTGDDHAKPVGTALTLQQLKDHDPPGCSVADWQCIRGTSYIYPDTPLSNDQAKAFQDDGFEIALHLTTGCSDFTPASLAINWDAQKPAFTAKYGSIAPPRTNRTHCIPWSDWASEAIVGLQNGIRLDTNYYYWPPTWMLEKPGMFTGSGMPMRFAGVAGPFDGTPIDVYQATTQLTDEWGDDELDLGVAAHITALLNRALGAEGYYGAFTANMHTDEPNHPGTDTIVNAAKSRSVPVISAAQLLDWVDGREGSSFHGLSYSGNQLRFGVRRGTKARGLEAMVPARAPAGALTALTRGGASVARTARRVKGIDYVVFDAVPGAYVATYGAVSGPPPRTGGVTPSTPEGETARSAPRVKVMQRRARVRRNGTVRLRLRCPRTVDECRANVRLRRRGKTLAKRTVTLPGGKTSVVKLRLKRTARARLARAGSLRVTVRVRVTLGERKPSITTKRILLLAP